ncbi:dihydroorotate dehydrogenase [Clostridium tunisiense]|uniref:dihydroorotate dehydrogenase n=1 Tax=Clostridium tunisiense TaxID=219748 RepID=UPI0002D735B0|nr:dihydroorotate dehydrogenase [Clostridium tunisiense]
MLKVNICGKEFKNPIIAASGTFGFGEEYNEFYNVECLGGIATKGLTLNKREGNFGVRIYETKSGILNSVGLQNPGVHDFINCELPNMKGYDTNIIANLGGATLEEYVEAVELLNDTEIDFVELNISCPNVKQGGMALGIKSNVAYEAVSAVKSHCKKPLIVKLSPNAEDIVDMALKCIYAGADALSLVNTFKAMAIDYKNRKPIFENVYAGLSGPAIKPIALRMVHEVSKISKVPVIGMGGITTWQDAVEFIMAGATAVQVGTANFMNPLACKDIISGVEDFLRSENIKDINEIRGII